MCGAGVHVLERTEAGKGAKEPFFFFFRAPFHFPVSPFAKETAKYDQGPR